MPQVVSARDHYRQPKFSYWDGFITAVSSATFMPNPEIYEYPHENQLEALRKDWEMVGRDLYTAIDAINAEA